MTSKYEEVEKNKSCGVENLNPAILKQCAPAISIPMTIIFKESFEKSQLPAQFRSANATPLYKKVTKL